MGKDIALNGLSNKPRDNKVIVDVSYDPKHSLFSGSWFKAVLFILLLAVERLRKACIPIKGKQSLKWKEIWSGRLYSDVLTAKKTAQYN